MLFIIYGFTRIDCKLSKIECKLSKIDCKISKIDCKLSNTLSRGNAVVVGKNRTLHPTTENVQGTPLFGAVENNHLRVAQSVKTRRNVGDAPLARVNA